MYFVYTVRYGIEPRAFDTSDLATLYAKQLHQLAAYRTEPIHVTFVHDDDLIAGDLVVSLPPE